MPQPRKIRFSPGSPCVEVAIRAAITGLALPGVFIAPQPRSISAAQARPSGSNVVGHLLAHILAARLAGIGGGQADPFLVMVAAAPRLAEMVLFAVRYFMHQRRKTLLGGPRAVSPNSN
jgi:hypothetical protein